MATPLQNLAAEVSGHDLGRLQLCLSPGCPGEATGSRGWGRYCPSCRKRIMRERGAVGTHETAVKGNAARRETMTPGRFGIAARELLAAATALDRAERRHTEARQDVLDKLRDYQQALLAMPGHPTPRGVHGH